MKIHEMRLVTVSLQRFRLKKVTQDIFFKTQGSALIIIVIQSMRRHLKKVKKLYKILYWFWGWSFRRQRDTTLRHSVSWTWSCFQPFRKCRSILLPVRCCSHTFRSNRAWRFGPCGVHRCKSRLPSKGRGWSWCDLWRNWSAKFLKKEF